MGLILRLASRAIWSGDAPDEDRRARAVGTFARRDVDTDGLSVFAVEGERDREVVVAAIACRRADDDPVDFLEVPSSVIERYGPVTLSPGDTPVASANALHRSLDWDAATLALLAHELVEARTSARRARPAAVRAAVAKLQPSDLDPAEVDAVAFLLRIRSRQGP